MWLIVVEFTIVTFGWKLTLDSGLLIAQAIWAIGPSMVILSVLIYLPQALIVVISLLVIAGHNFFDFITAGSLGHASWIWVLLHQPGVLDISPAVKLLVIYPLVPWPAVMAVGYVLGPLFIGDSKYRRTFLLSCGSTLLVGFFLLRASNIYRDPTPWRSQCSLIAAALSFLDCEKYPPSLLFLMMTLGPAMILLAVLEKKDSTVSVILKTFGRVPFLFYVVHLPLIHAAAIVLAWLTISNVDWLFGSFVPAKPAGYGLDLPGVYLVWIGVLVLLYPFCAWFAGLKDRRKDWWWLSYL